MADFDPYRKWLGIPPHEQPPNFYRLLGVPPFESDAEVIANASDRLMAHLRTFQGGQHSALSQKILNEVSAARICLLDAKKRAEYDARLQIKTGGPEIRAAATSMDRGRGRPGSLEDSSIVEPPPIIKFPQPRPLPPVMTYRRSSRRRKNRLQGPIISLIFSGVALLVTIGLLYYQYVKRREEPAAKKQAAIPKSSPVNLPKKAIESNAKEASPKTEKPSPPAPLPKGEGSTDDEKTGMRLCFFEGNWGEGLPKLADSANENIKRLAQRELAPPRTTGERLALADDWWAVGERYAPPARDNIRRHAVEWYEKIVGELEDSNKDRAEWRIDLGKPHPGEKPPVNPEELE